MGNPKTAVTLGSFGTVMSRLHFCRGTNKIEMSRFTWDLPAIKYRSWLERSVRVCTSSRGVWPRERTPCVGAIEVHKRLVTFGFRQHSLDSQMYYLVDKLPGSKTATLVCLVICYVDDFLLTHNSRFDRQPVLKLFSWGSQDESYIKCKWMDIRAIWMGLLCLVAFLP